MNECEWLGEGSWKGQGEDSRKGLRKLGDNLSVNKKAMAFHLEQRRPRKLGPLSLPQPELGQHEADTGLIPSPGPVITAAKEGPVMTQARGTAGARSTRGTEK